MTTPAVTVRADGLAKSFGRKAIFRDVSFRLRERETLLITGRNGSGKSTLAKILCGVLSPSGGRVVFDPDPGDNHALRASIVGLVAPYLQVYDEFSAEENLLLFMRIRGLRPSAAVVREFLGRVGLQARKDDPVRGYSSGMRQRVKYAAALLHRPPILVLDEPMANLDAEGIGVVRGIMAEQQSRGILVVATNDLTDIAGYDQRVDLDSRPR